MPSCALAKRPASLGSVLRCHSLHSLHRYRNSMNSLEPILTLGREKELIPLWLWGPVPCRRRAAQARCEALRGRQSSWAQWHLATCCPCLSPGGSKPRAGPQAPSQPNQDQGEVLWCKPGVPPTGDKRESQRPFREGLICKTGTRCPSRLLQWLVGTAVSKYLKWGPKATEFDSIDSGGQPPKSWCQPGHLPGH